jgi:hypothetical protein
LPHGIRVVIDAVVANARFQNFFPGKPAFCDQPPVGRKKPRSLAMQRSIGCGMRKLSYGVKKDAIRPHYQSVLKEYALESQSKLMDVEAAIEMGRLAFLPR